MSVLSPPIFDQASTSASTINRSRSKTLFLSATRLRWSPIAQGDKVIKFGVPIGRAKIAIEIGEHVHVHNVESAYINNAVDHYEA